MSAVLKRVINIVYVYKHKSNLQQIIIFEYTHYLVTLPLLTVHPLCRDVGHY